jgi:hypothetical protein
MSDIWATFVTLLFRTNLGKLVRFLRLTYCHALLLMSRTLDSFARKGIPIAFFFSGTHIDYDHPTDTLGKIIFDKMANTVRLIYMAGWDLANAPHRPIINGNTEMYR